MTPALRKRLQYLLSTLSVLLVAGVLFAGWGWWRMRGSLAQLDGQRELAGLTAPVKIERDALGVPTVAGETRADVARALGFLHAQDRFFQMDLQRRRAAGELAEQFGAKAVGLDQNARTHGFRRLAEKVVAQAQPAQRELLAAYTAGVNAGLAALGVKPWEYLVLRTEPQPWREEDSILCIYTMWLDLQDHTASFELNRDALRRALGQSAVEFLAPRGTSWDAALDGSLFAPAPLPKFRFKAPEVEVSDLSRPGSGNLMPLASTAEKRVLGSNAFALSGAHTTTGAALVANDMHLDLGLPHVWYRASLQWNDAGTARRVTGVTLPGMPFVVAGSNGRVAWGFTDAYIDTTDLIVTDLDATAQIFYRTLRGWIPVEERKERILVKGGEPVTHLVRWTEWGPVVGKAENGRFHVLRWSAHDADATNLDFMDLERAGTTAEAVAIAHRSGIPNENMLIGDADGTVAWTIIGRIPQRIGYDGRLPVTWAFGDRRWDGWLSSADTPVVISRAGAHAGEIVSPDGVLWNGNNRAVGGEAYAKLGDGGYDEGQRARQIRDGLRALVESGRKATPADLLAVQLDHRAVFLERWQRFLLEILTDDVVAQKSARGELRELARQWSGRADVDSVAYRVVRSFRGHVAARALAPFADQAAQYHHDFSYGRLPYEDALWQLTHERPLPLLNPAHRSWDSLLLAAVDDVIAEAKAANLPLKRFTWGAHNRLRMEHPFARFLPESFRGLLAMPADSLPGDSDMPRVQQRKLGQSERMVVSPGHETEGTLSMPGGQSGHPLSDFFRAGHDAWAKGEATPFLPGPAQHTLTLTPP